MPSKPIDELPAAIEHLRAWASAQRVPWVTGTLSEARADIPRVQFASGDYGQPAFASAQAFARTLGELDVAMLVVSIITLDRDSQQAAVALFEDPDPQAGELSSAVRFMNEKMLSQAHAAGDHIGQPGSIMVTAITRNPTIAIDWSESADWYVVIEAADMAYDNMPLDEVIPGPQSEDGDYDEWEEIHVEPEPEPPPSPRRRIQPRR